MIRSPFHVAGAVQAALGSCGLAAAHLWEQRTGQKQSVTVDFERAAASLISYQMASASGELVMTASSITASTNPPAVADAHRLLPMPGIVRCRDGGWCHLHSSFAPAKVLEVLDVDATLPVDEILLRLRLRRRSPPRSLRTLSLAQAREAWVYPGAMVRSAEEWLAHPQGQALVAVPTVEVVKIADGEPVPFDPHEQGDDRPLSGMRVLDVTRVLAARADVRPHPRGARG